MISGSKRIANGWQIDSWLAAYFPEIISLRDKENWYFIDFIYNYDMYDINHIIDEINTKL